MKEELIELILEELERDIYHYNDTIFFLVRQLLKTKTIEDLDILNTTL